MDKYYCWACDFSSRTGEGNLARLFIKKVIYKIIKYSPQVILNF